MPTTDVQEREIHRLLGDEYDSFTVTPNTGPNGDRAVVSCPDGRLVVFSRRGSVMADSRRDWRGDQVICRMAEREIVSRQRPYDPSVDALLVERCDGEWALVGPWRCAISATDHLPSDGVETLLEEMRAWHRNIVGDDLTVWVLHRDAKLLERHE